jgi:hypothetical protein
MVTFLVVLPVYITRSSRTKDRACFTAIIPKNRAIAHKISILKSIVYRAYNFMFFENFITLVPTPHQFFQRPIESYDGEPTTTLYRTKGE